MTKTTAKAPVLILIKLRAREFVGVKYIVLAMFWIRTIRLLPVIPPPNPMISIYPILKKLASQVVYTKILARRDDVHHHATLLMMKAPALALVLVFVLPILDKLANMPRMNLADVFHFNILLNRVCFPESYAKVACQMN